MHLPIITRLVHRELSTTERLRSVTCSEISNALLRHLLAEEKQPSGAPLPGAAQSSAIHNAARSVNEMTVT